VAAAACPLDSARAAGIGSLRGFDSFTMAHPRLIEAKDELVQTIEGSAPGSLILVLGPTGVGKTTLIRKVQQCLAERLAPQLEAEAGRFPFIGVEAIAPDNGNFNWRDHFRRMLLQMQEPLIDYKARSAYVQVDRNAAGQFVASPRIGTGAQMQYAVEQALHHRRPAAVFIDEAQHLARVSSGRKLADQLDVVKSIASRTQTIHVLIGTYELLAFRNLSGQLSRRSMDLHFSRYRAEQEADLQVFRNVVLTFQQQLPPEQALDLAQSARRLPGGAAVQPSCVGANGAFRRAVREDPRGNSRGREPFDGRSRIQHSSPAAAGPWRGLVRPFAHGLSWIAKTLRRAKAWCQAATA
jgi:energy-coupling factor transporter ATP-binding protein EcfA2